MQQLVQITSSLLIWPSHVEKLQNCKLSQILGRFLEFVLIIAITISQFPGRTEHLATNDTHPSGVGGDKNGARGSVDIGQVDTNTIP